ncbi:hypothetical protein WR25_03607 [Diploscapter pachys]|uniref:Battenin n=1 Tax=Diploscapter pachys TaxID=2018661 RepID=A0A2A2KCP3_9BILA|nr:hypothetical protein WR25_03607 [Diploscapter pachys]
MAEMQTQEKIEPKERKRNLAAFWIFGFCKNFTFVVMLTAAQDILAKSKDTLHNDNRLNSSTITDFDDDHCIADVSQRKCFEQSAGVLLICNILPSLIAKLIAPFTFGIVSYGVGNWVVCILQAISILMVALSDGMWVNLIGVGIGAFSNGLGESYLLSMTALYHKDTVAVWASGTGLAGVVSSLFYSILTDRKMAALSSSWAIMITLFVPVLSIVTNMSERKEPISKFKTFVGLLKFILIFVVLYFAQYFVNQGLLEITIYDCAHSFGKGPYAQYRWYQVLYQWGVFLSRSSKKFLTFGLVMMLIFPWLQVLLAIAFVVNAMFVFIPHFAIASFLVLLEGIIGGIVYVNVYSYVHKNTPEDVREFALSVVSPAQTLGVVLAAFAAIPAHNLICDYTTPKILWLF